MRCGISRAWGECHPTAPIGVARLPAGADPCPERTATMRNLVALGFPDAGDPGSFLLRNARPEWRTADKGSRRAAIAQQYRIVALLGDDLRDFVERDVFAARRAELMPLFGERWFVLPNPVYGSWERALVIGACGPGDAPRDCRRKELERKYSRLASKEKARDLYRGPLLSARP